MRVVRRLLVVALFVAALVLGWQFARGNAAPVTVDYLVDELVDVSLWTALLGAFAAGAAIVGAIGLYQVAKLRLVTRRYRKTVEGLEAEVHQLRNLPLATEGPALGEPVSLTASAPGGVLERGA
ncbi:MAG: lipopolysaccharide assembly protein LapA domain-containing protein [Myxococcales bacterium]|nr:lipopolysaccharide assembly protein LapA domain-containing protein [Myxococcales bacterium]